MCRPRPADLCWRCLTLATPSAFLPYHHQCYRPITPNYPSARETSNLTFNLTSLLSSPTSPPQSSLTPSCIADTGLYSPRAGPASSQRRSSFYFSFFESPLACVDSPFAADNFLLLLRCSLPQSTTCLTHRSPSTLGLVSLLSPRDGSMGRLF